MSWDGTIYLNGDGGISSMGALLGCATGTGVPVAPYGYRFFSAWGTVGGLGGWARTTIGNTDHPGTWLALVAEGGYQFPSSYSAVTDGLKWRGHGMSTGSQDGLVNGQIFNPYGAINFRVSGWADAGINTAGNSFNSASARLQLRLMYAGPYNDVPQQSAVQPFTAGDATARYNSMGSAYVSNLVGGPFTGGLGSMVPNSPGYPAVALGVGVNSVYHSPSGQFTGYNGYRINGGSTSRPVTGGIRYNNMWTASGFAPLSAY